MIYRKHAIKTLWYSTQPNSASTKNTLIEESLIVQVIINVQKRRVNSILLITFFVRKIKIPNLEQVFYTYSFFTF